MTASHRAERHVVGRDVSRTLWGASEAARNRCLPACRHLGSASTGSHMHRVRAANVISCSLYISEVTAWGQTRDRIQIYCVNLQRFFSCSPVCGQQ